ncbi:Potassium channel [Physocladia obscura]|uniref:Potassium channel n=1 Tax=Physocladia obscura TaxID=109957 RepID=A0AAD5XC91_9FUNG|nr:Potassium channel [Physocladia obscura]
MGISVAFCAAGLLFLHLDLQRLYRDIQRFAYARNVFFAKVKRLAKDDPRFEQSIFWRGDNFNDENSQLHLLNLDLDIDLENNGEGSAIDGQIINRGIIDDQLERDHLDRTVLTSPPKRPGTIPKEWMVSNVTTSNSNSGSNHLAKETGETIELNDLPVKSPFPSKSAESSFGCSPSVSRRNSIDGPTDEILADQRSTLVQPPLPNPRVSNFVHTDIALSSFDTVHSLSLQLGTSGKGLNELLNLEPTAPVLAEMSTVFQEVMTHLSSNSFVPPANLAFPKPPVFEHSWSHALLFSLACVLCAFINSLLITLALSLIINAVKTSQYMLGIGGAYLYFQASLSWLILLIHLFNIIQVTHLVYKQRVKQSPGTPKKIKLSRGDFDKMRESRIFAIVCVVFFVWMNASIVALAAIEHWPFRWAEQWYYATIAGIGFTLNNVQTFAGKVYTQTVAVVAFLLTGFILVLGSGMMLAYLRDGVYFSIRKSPWGPVLVERQRRKQRFLGMVSRTDGGSRASIGTLTGRAVMFSVMVLTAFQNHLNVIVTVLSMGLLWLFGSLLFGHFESWSFIDSSYFVVNILLTEGYNDFYPTTSLGRVFVYFYCLLALGFWAGCVSLFVDKLQNVRLAVHGDSTNKNLTNDGGGGSHENDTDFEEGVEARGKRKLY